MTVFTFANNINTTLANAITAGATSITLNSTVGLPASIASGTVLVITLNDVATRANYEVMYATAITGATLTVTRGQEGTTALAWLGGDYAFSGVTAGQMRTVTNGRLLGVRVFSTAGTFTYNKGVGTNSVIVEVQGGAAASGGPVTTGTTNVSCCGPGSNGSYCQSLYTSGFDGATVVVGQGGAGIVGAQGGSGGVSSFGATPTPMSAPGGIGGGNNLLVPPTTSLSAAPPAIATGGNIINLIGATGGCTIATGVNNGSIGYAAPSMFQFSYGKGGDGVINVASQAARAGNNGNSGIVIVWEYA